MQPTLCCCATLVLSDVTSDYLRWVCRYSMSTVSRFLVPPIFVRNVVILYFVFLGCCDDRSQRVGWFHVSNSSFYCIVWWLPLATRRLKPFELTIRLVTVVVVCYCTVPTPLATRRDATLSLEHCTGALHPVTPRSCSCSCS